jgi:hypothetical protein
LIAGSFGIGGNAYAEPFLKEGEARAECITREASSTAEVRDVRPPIERMP